MPVIWECVYDHDSDKNPRAFDGYSLLHISFGLIAGSVLDAVSVVWWGNLIIIFGIALIWEVVEHVFSKTLKPLFGLDKNEKDSFLNQVCDVLVALAGFGLSIVIPWPANLITGSGFLLLGIWWGMMKSQRELSEPLLNGSPSPSPSSFKLW